LPAAPGERAWFLDKSPCAGASDRRTRITQRVILLGDNATARAPQVRNSFGLALADGMKRIADAMASAERSAEAIRDQ